MDENDFGSSIIITIFLIVILLIVVVVGYQYKHSEISHELYIEISHCLPECQPEIDEAMSDGKISPNEYYKIKTTYDKKVFAKTKNALLGKKAEKE